MESSVILQYVPLSFGIVATSARGNLENADAGSVVQVAPRKLTISKSASPRERARRPLSVGRVLESDK